MARFSRSSSWACGLRAIGRRALAPRQNDAVAAREPGTLARPGSRGVSRSDCVFLSRRETPRDPSNDPGCPVYYSTGKLRHHLRLVPARPLEHVKRVVAAFHQAQRGTLPESLYDRPQQLQVRELVPRALQEQHGYFDLDQVLRA